MAIAVHERTLAPDDPLLSITSQPSTAVRISLEGAAEGMVYLAGVCFALLEPSSPKLGVLSPMPQMGYIVIAYCADTRRISVVATDMMMLSDASTYTEQLNWLTAGRSTSVDCLIVYPGDLCYDPEVAFSALRTSAAPLPVQLSLDAHIAPAEAGIIEVLRATPACTFLYATPGMLNPECVVAPDMTILDSAGILTTYDLFVAVVSHVKPPPLWKRYDGQRGADRLPILSDAARSQLQTARDVNLEDGRHLGKLRAVVEFNQLHSKIMGTAPRGDGWSALATYCKMQLAGVLAWGAYCPVCGAVAKKICGGCGAETYCSVEHQREDWPHHKGWCKQNRKQKSS